MLKRISFFLLASVQVLFLCACVKNDDVMNWDESNYTELKIEPPVDGAPIDICVHEDIINYYVFDKGNVNCYSFQNNEWKLTQSVPVLMAKNKLDFQNINILISPLGELAILMQPIYKNDIDIYYGNPSVQIGSNIVEINLSVLGIKNNRIIDFAYANKHFVLSTPDIVLIFNEKGEKAGYIEASNSRLLNKKNELSIVTHNSVICYDLKQGEVINTVNRKEGIVGEGQNRLLLLNYLTKRVETLNSQLPISLMYPEDFDFALMGFQPYFLYESEKKNIYMGCYNNGINEIRRYSYNPGSKKPIRIKVYSLYDSPTMWQAIYNYHKDNPKKLVRYTIISNSLQNPSTDKIIEMLKENDKPDVMILDGLEIDSLIGSGILEDLSEKVDLSKSLDNISLSFLNEEGLQAIPARFAFPALGARTMENLDKIQSCSDLTTEVYNAPPANGTSMFTEDAFNNPAVIFNTEEGVFDVMFPVFYNYIWEKGLEYNVNAYETFLIETKKIIDYNQLAKVPDALYSINPNNSMTNFLNSNAKYFCENITRTDNVLFGFWKASDKSNQNGFVKGMPAEGNDSVLFPTCIVAAPLGASEEGIELIRSIFDVDIQKMNLGDGIANHRDAIKSVFEECSNNYNVQIKNDFLHEIEQSLPIVMNKEKLQISKSIALQYYSGDISLEKACRQFEQKASSLFE